MPKVECDLERCKHNRNGECTAVTIYLSDDHACNGGCDDGWEFGGEPEEWANSGMT